MSGEPIRFIHAADLHLELPFSGITPVPESLRAKLIAAPFVAAQRVFETARMESVDFVVLSGDIVHPLQAGASSICFLLEELERLAGADIPVYWAGGRVDRFHQWPKAVSLPSSVYRSGSRDVRGQPFYRTGEVAALLQLSGYQGRGLIDADQLASESQSAAVIAVAHGELKAADLSQKPVTYWAMGGKHQSVTERFEDVVVHYPGTPQGRTPMETGPHGCTLVQIDAGGQVETQFIECDSVQWLRREMRLTASTSRRKMERNLVEMTRDLAAQERSQPQLVQWAVSGTERVAWTSPTVAEEILVMLRQRFESMADDVWITGLEFLHPEAFPEPVVESETIATEFLETVRQFRGSSDWPTVLAEQFEHYPGLMDLLGERLLKKKHDREELLRQVAYFGLDLLGAQQALDGSDPTDPRTLREAS